MEQTEKWFKDHIGKEIDCTPAPGKQGYTGKMRVIDENHAGYLFNISQNVQRMAFDEVKAATPARLVLTREHFNQLVRGEVVTIGEVKLILADIGYPNMLEAIGMAKGLNLM